MYTLHVFIYVIAMYIYFGNRTQTRNAIYRKGKPNLDVNLHLVFLDRLRMSKLVYFVFFLVYLQDYLIAGTCLLLPQLHYVQSTSLFFKTRFHRDGVILRTYASTNTYIGIPHVLNDKWRRGAVSQWVERLTIDRWIRVSREFEPHQRPPQFP